jgi:hypothetical protein
MQHALCACAFVHLASRIKPTSNSRLKANSTQTLLLLHSTLNTQPPTPDTQYSELVLALALELELELETSESELELELELENKNIKAQGPRQPATCKCSLRAVCVFYLKMGALNLK